MAKRGKLKAFADKEPEERPIRIKKYKYLFLIVCEDENTECKYFEQFKVQIPEGTIYLKAVGTGRDPKGVVERAIKETEDLTDQSGKEVDVVWVVFDKDDADLNEKRIQRFNDAFSIAAGHKNMKLAPSNEVFELWLLLHLTDVASNVALPRQTIYQLLQEHIRTLKGYTTFEYEHGKESVLEPVRIMGDQTAAIQRAKALHEIQSQKPFLEANPCTLVYVLIEELMEWIRYFSYKPE
jgi:hypothetical protein